MRGTDKGAIGGSGEFVMDNGTLNGYINGPKSITINGGNINTTFGPGAYVYSIYLKEDSELDINGGAIYAKNNSTKDEGGSAFAIMTEKNDRITLKKNVNITAEAYSSSMPSASIWYYDSEDQNVIDATGVTEFTHPLTIAARSTA